MKYTKFNLFTVNKFIHFLHKQINCSHSFMTSARGVRPQKCAQFCKWLLITFW